MIAVTDTSAFSSLEFVETPSPFLIPSESEIENLVPANAFINASVTTAFKTLLKRISTESVDPTLGTYLQPNTLLTKVSGFFNGVGFYFNSGVVSYLQNAFDLDFHTSEIINTVNNYTSFQEKAYKAFHDNSWSQEANDIRALNDTGLQKLHYITVYSNSNANSGFNQENLTNAINILNTRNETADRFLLINLDAAADPEMPNLRVFNNSNVQIKLRIAVEYNNYVNPDTEGGMAGAFGPAIPNDNNLDGTIGANERVHLNRRFLDYFPNQANAQDVEGTIYTRIIDAQNSWDVDFDERIRGGEVTITYFPEPQNVNSWDEGDHHNFKFHIRGKNPTYLQVENYLNAQNYLQRFWFLIRKLRQECGAIQRFNGINPIDDDYEFRHFDRVNNIGQYNLRRNSDNGLPVFGFPRGYGMGQIDNIGEATTNDVPTPPPVGETTAVQLTEGTVTGTRTVDHFRKIVATDEEVWNWKENIDRGVWFLENEKMNITTNKITTIRDRVTAWNTANPSDLVDVPAPEYYDSIIYTWIASDIAEFAPFNDLFNEGTPPTIVDQGARELKSFFDAMLLKSYNGNTGGHFMDINGASSDPAVKPILSINPTNNINPYYVRNLSNRDD
jgi:hypothetical protein